VVALKTGAVWVPVKVLAVASPAAPKLVKATAAVVAPVPPLAIATVPVSVPAEPVVLLVIFAGMSAATSARKVGVPALPDPGPANTVLIASEARVIVRVPEDVTGLLVTVKMLGADKPTLVTDPAATQTASPYASMPVAYSPLHSVGAVLNSGDGISVAVKTRKVGTAAEPDTGPAKNVLAVSVFSVRAKVPDPVTGLSDTVKMSGADRPTLVTTPDEMQTALPLESMPMENWSTHCVGVVLNTTEGMSAVVKSRKMSV
jgi:hypothetical protein